MKRFLFTTIASLCLIGGHAQNITFADANVKSICVANWDTNGDGELSEAEAAAVTDLGSVFYFNTSITSFDELQYFTGLTSIGNYAFSGCSSLASVIIPNSVTSVDNAFFNCRGLASITIPNSVTSIGDKAFQSCTGLASIIVEIGNPIYDSRDNCNAIVETSTNTLISGCKNTVIPSSVTIIGDNAFEGCSGLTSITIPNSVTSIGDNAFNRCIDLTSITVEIGNTIYDSRDNCNAIIETATNTLITGCKNTVIPASVTSIGDYAFSFKGLTAITIPSSVTSIGDYAFSHNGALTAVISETDTPFNFGSNAFASISNNCTLTVPAGTRDAYIAAGWTEDVFKGGVVENILFDALNIVVEQMIDIAVEEGSSYQGKTAEVDIAGILQTLGVSSLNNIMIYAIQSNGVLDPSYKIGTVDGWRNADGDWQSWGSDAYFYVKADFSRSTNHIYEAGTMGYDGQYGNANLQKGGIFTAKYAFVKNNESKDAVILHININLPGTNSILIAPTTLDFSSYGQTADLMVQRESTGLTVTNVTWTSSDESVATVNNEGVVTAVGNGTTTIIAVTNEIPHQRAICTITVNIPSEPDTDISQLDNVVYMERTEAIVGTEQTLSIKMKNTDGIQTVQFDLYLPDGVEVVRDEEGYELIELSLERTTARKMDQFSAVLTSGGAYRFLINSTRGNTFDGTDGEIATVRVRLADDMSVGDYPVVFRDIVLVNTSSVGYRTEYVKCTLSVDDYIPGNVNDDKSVDAIDLNAITNYILERRTFPFTFNVKAGDVNGDSVIDAIDLNAVTNMILHDSQAGAKPRAVVVGRIDNE